MTFILFMPAVDGISVCVIHIIQCLLYRTKQSLQCLQNARMKLADMWQRLPQKSGTRSSKKAACQEKLKYWEIFINHTINNVLLVKIEGPVWYTIHHHLPVVKGVSSNPSIFINQPMGKGHLCIPYHTHNFRHPPFPGSWVRNEDGPEDDSAFVRAAQIDIWIDETVDPNTDVTENTRWY